LRQEVNHFASVYESQSGEDKDQTLNKLRLLSCGKAMSYSPEQLWQIGAQSLGSGFFDQLGRQLSNLSCGVIVDRGAQQPINDYQRNLNRFFATLGIAPGHELIKVM
jgi:hypothetical protein